MLGQIIETFHPGWLGCSEGEELHLQEDLCSKDVKKEDGSGDTCEAGLGQLPEQRKQREAFSTSPGA